MCLIGSIFSSSLTKPAHLQRQLAMQWSDSDLVIRCGCTVAPTRTHCQEKETQSGHCDLVSQKLGCKPELHMALLEGACETGRIEAQETSSI